MWPALAILLFWVVFAIGVIAFAKGPQRTSNVVRVDFRKARR